MTGWIKLHRKFIEWEWYDDANAVRLFLHLLLRATHKPTKYRGHDLRAGDVVYGHEAFAGQLGLSVKNLRTALGKLKYTGEVAIKKTNKFSIISIVKWDDYQGDRQATGKQLASNRQATGSIQKGKKERSEEGTIAPVQNEPSAFDLFWEQYPRQRRGNKARAQAAYNLALKDGRATEAEIADGLNRYIYSQEVARGYAKGAAAWLSDDRWSHDYSKQAPTGGGQSQAINDAFSRAAQDIRDGQHEQ